MPKNIEEQIKMYKDYLEIMQGESIKEKIQLVNKFKAEKVFEINNKNYLHEQLSINDKNVIIKLEALKDEPTLTENFSSDFEENEETVKIYVKEKLKKRIFLDHLIEEYKKELNKFLQEERNKKTKLEEKIKKTELLAEKIELIQEDKSSLKKSIKNFEKYVKEKFDPGPFLGASASKENILDKTSEEILTIIKKIKKRSKKEPSLEKYIEIYKNAADLKKTIEIINFQLKKLEKEKSALFDELDIEESDELDVEKSDELTTEKSNELDIEKPDELTTKKPNKLDIEKPDELDVIKKQYLEELKNLEEALEEALDDTIDDAYEELRSMQSKLEITCQDIRKKSQKTTNLMENLYNDQIDISKETRNFIEKETLKKESKEIEEIHKKKKEEIIKKSDKNLLLVYSQKSNKNNKILKILSRNFKNFCEKYENQIPSNTKNLPDDIKLDISSPPKNTSISSVIWNDFITNAKWYLETLYYFQDRIEFAEKTTFAPISKPLKRIITTINTITDPLTVPKEIIRQSIKLLKMFKKTNDTIEKKLKTKDEILMELEKEEKSFEEAITSEFLDELYSISKETKSLVNDDEETLSASEQETLRDETQETKKKKKPL